MPGEGPRASEDVPGVREAGGLKNGVKVTVVTRKAGLFGSREVVRRKTLTVSRKECRRPEQGKWNRPAFSEEERLAALFLAWEDELSGK